MSPNRSGNSQLPRRDYLGDGVDAVPSPPHLAHERAERWIVTELDEKCGAAGLMRGDDVACNQWKPYREFCKMFRAISGQNSPAESREIRVMRGATIETISLLSRPMRLERLSAGRIQFDEVAWQHDGEIHRLRAIWTHPETELRAVVWFLPSAAWITQEVPLDPDDPTFQLIDSSRAMESRRCA